ncbi:hypothetical protein PIB30_029487 [Stylosanthes scabra]|uniref:Ubiquitin-like protease family profile domain-containing protein n=1 Tax=Stylosanthes scabra TaxID=79078 RepID=A0ABU6RBI5_9FABA|nr:hypothetical protein [Stylosanthes scabra]
MAIILGSSVFSETLMLAFRTGFRPNNCLLTRNDLCFRVSRRPGSATRSPGKGGYRNALEIDRCRHRAADGKTPNVAPSPPSSNNSVLPTVRGYHPLQLSIVTSVASLQCEVRTLSEGISEHRKVLSEIRQAVADLHSSRGRGSDSKRNHREGCSCICHRTTKPAKGSKTPRGKKRQRDNEKMSADSTYLPTLDTNFSVDHMPRRVTRKSARGKQPVVVDVTSEARPSVDHTKNVADSNPQTPSGMRYFNHLAPIGERGYPDVNELLGLRVARIPKTVWSPCPKGISVHEDLIHVMFHAENDLEFRPTQEMDIYGVELVVATYIFSGDVSLGFNRLVVTGTEHVGEDAIRNNPSMLVVSPNYSHAALLGPRLSQANVAALKLVHMRSKVDDAVRVYVPMWCPGHWYLMILDVPGKKMIYLDSYCKPDEVDDKKDKMIEVALYLESITLGQKWLSRPNAERPRFSAFEIEQASVPQQERESNDCGIWLSHWMILEALWSNYDAEAVGPASRMKLATGLVLKPHNPMAREVVQRAFNHWRSKDLDSVPLRRAL